MSHIKNIKLESFNEKANHAFIFCNHGKNFRAEWSFLEKVLFKNYILQGRVINKTPWGYLLGFFGYIGFVSKVSTSKNLRIGEMIYFNIIKLDYTGKSILLKIKDNQN